MNAEALHLLALRIREKLQNGRLPRDSSPRAGGSPGDGAICDACEAIITADQVMMEVGPLTGEKRSLCLHADCFQLAFSYGMWRGTRSSRSLHRVTPLSSARLAPPDRESSKLHSVVEHEWR